MAEFGRLDYLTPAGWGVGHSGLNLIDPQRYVDKLHKDRQVTARFVPLGEDFQPIHPSILPPPPHEANGRAPVHRISECEACGNQHRKAWECIL
jgi:hypothetical protein